MGIPKATGEAPGVPSAPALAEDRPEGAAATTTKIMIGITPTRRIIMSPVPAGTPPPGRFMAIEHGGSSERFSGCGCPDTPRRQSLIYR